MQKFYDTGHHSIIVDASADTLLKLSDWARGKDILLFNIRATDVSLRQENCRANVMHVVPDRYMLADALAQYLVLKKWTNWLLVHGSTPGDRGLCRRDQTRRRAVRRHDRRSARVQGRLRRHDATMSASSLRASRRASMPPSPPTPTTTSSSSPMKISCSGRICPIVAAASRGRSRERPASSPPPGAQATRSGAPRR